MFSPGARIPWLARLASQLLNDSGWPAAFAAPTARTLGSAAGMCRHSQPSFPVAAMTTTFCRSQLSHNLGEERVFLSRHDQLTAADIDQMCTGFESQRNGARQIFLAARPKLAFF